MSHKHESILIQREICSNHRKFSKFTFIHHKLQHHRSQTKEQRSQFALRQTTNNKHYFKQRKSSQKMYGFHVFIFKVC